MQCREVLEKASPQHRHYGCKVPHQDLGHADLVVVMCFFQVVHIPLEPIFAFPFLDLGLHGGHVGGQLEPLAIAEPDVVVGVAFAEDHIFGFEGCVQVAEGFLEKLR